MLSKIAHLFNIKLTLVAVIFCLLNTGCEDDPLLDETDTNSNNAGGSYGQISFPDSTIEIDLIKIPEQHRTE